MLLDSPRLPDVVRNNVGRGDIRWVFHQVSLWETQIKYDLGKLPLPEPPVTMLPPAIKESGMSYERIEDSGIYMLGKLPPIHRDPFDRLLVAHAVAHGWEMATVDAQVTQYPVRVFVGD
jgi:PIN domain nuclease of toxin-antitoxin system